jgi:hypothetical protein
MVDVAEEVGHLEGVHLGSEGREYGDADPRDVDGTELDLLDDGLLLAELGAGVHFDLDPAVGAFFHELGELVIALGGG